MTITARPRVDCDRQHPTLTVADVPAAIDFYTGKLGFELGFTWGDPPALAGVTLDRVQIFLERGTPASRGNAIYFVVGNADELHAFQRANGVEVDEPPGDRDYGLRDYSVLDLHGHRLTFGHPIFDVGPDVPVERVDVAVRLEKRLAAVLQELAAHKGTTVSSCLEETLLHTFEPLGEGVASPHTPSQLRYIQELKKKHGIDYDTHASYRFVER